MSPRRSIKLPILLAVVMLALLIVLIVGWVMLAVYGALADKRSAGIYWALLSVGTTFLILLVVGVALYLALSIKAINLSRRQSNFIDSVTHELKSPIASLKLCLQTLNRHDVSQEQRADFYRYMLEDVERLDHLINQMLDAGRVESRPSMGEAEPLPVGPLARQCAEAVCLSYRLPPETVQIDVPPCVITAPRNDLGMILRNLLDNAVKYAGQPPEVRLEAALEDDRMVCLRVSDNGRGIPRHLRRKVFGRFFRLGSELERDKPGTGLGLYIVRTLVRRLRGSIEIRDRQPPPGTMFEVRLPGRAAARERYLQPSDDAAGTSQQEQKMRTESSAGARQP
jgi:signal transduction histidine kinase